jgi:hypothetical protein
MSIIKASKCEVEIQEQTDPDCACRYMTVLSYEPEGTLSKEIISVVLTDKRPIVKQTLDLGNRIVEKNVATVKKTTPEQLVGLEGHE